MLDNVPLENMDRANPYETLRTGLIWGRWKSGQRLIPKHLKTELNCTSSALREALLRLVGEGFVESTMNFGFRAVMYSEDDFRQAAHLRLILELEAVDIALLKGDFDWEIELSAAYNKLAYIENQMHGLEDVSEHIKRWSLQDWEFHETLLAACGSNVLMRAYKLAYDTFRMYAVSQIANFGYTPGATIDEHEAIYKSAIARDRKACARAIRAHLTLYKNNNRSNEPLPAKA